MEHKSTNPNTKITGDSSTIVSGVLAWLNDPNGSQHCTITGGPGAGKTWMIKELVTTYKSFNDLGIGTDRKLIVSATTHEALDNIAMSLHGYKNNEELRTIYSHLGLVPVKGKIHRRQGNKKLPHTYKPKPQEIHSEFNECYIVDESNFISQETLAIIQNWFPNIKIIFIGSENQLGTDIGKSKIFTQGWDNFYLNTTYRAKNKDVQAVYDNSEEDVINQCEPRFVKDNPSIVFLKGNDWERTLKEAYTSNKADKCITLAYTNKRVFELVGMIREAKGRAGYFDLAGPTQALRAGSSKISKKKVTLRRDNNNQVYVPVIDSSGNQLRSYVGETYEHFEYLISKEHKRRSDEIYPSLVASMEASTIHGAQGGTWDYTFLDLTNMYSLKRRDIETYRRMKHVAESRHTTKLFVKID